MKQLLSTIATVLCLLTLSPLGYSQTDIIECTVEPELGDSIYQLDGEAHRLIDLPLDLQQALYDAELQYYKAQKAIIDQSILLTEVERMAGESGQSVEETKMTLFETDLPTDTRVKEFFDQIKSRIDSPLDAIEEQIIQALKNRDVQEKQMKMLESLKRKGKFKLNLPKPIAPVVELAIDGFSRKGATNPPWSSSNLQIISALIAIRGRFVRGNRVNSGTTTIWPSNSTPTLFPNGRRLHLHDMATELPTEIETDLNKNS